MANSMQHLPSNSPSVLESATLRDEREVEDLLQKIREARSEVVEKLTNLNTYAEALKQQCRRKPNELATPLIMFATAHMRLARATLQGVSRATLIERVVDRGKQELVEAQRFEEDRLKRELAREARDKAHKQVDRLTFPVDVDAIDELFGEVDSNA